MPQSKWVPYCKFCGKTGGTNIIGGLRPPKSIPTIWGKCKLSVDGKHHCVWAPK